MIPDLTATSEIIMKIRKKTCKKIKKVSKMNNNLNLLKASKKCLIIVICLKLVSSHLRSSHLRSYHTRSYKKLLFGLSTKMINLSLEELRVIGKLRKVKNYKKKKKNEDESIKILSEAEQKRCIENIDSRDRFSKTKIKEIRRNHNETENKNSLSTS